jgi:hypothetical protein
MSPKQGSNDTQNYQYHHYHNYPIVKIGVDVNRTIHHIASQQFIFKVPNLTRGLYQISLEKYIIGLKQNLFGKKRPVRFCCLPVSRPKFLGNPT